MIDRKQDTVYWLDGDGELHEIHGISLETGVIEGDKPEFTTAQVNCEGSCAGNHGLRQPDRLKHAT